LRQEEQIRRRVWVSHRFNDYCHTTVIEASCELFEHASQAMGADWLYGMQEAKNILQSLKDTKAYESY